MPCSSGIAPRRLRGHLLRALPLLLWLAASAPGAAERPADPAAPAAALPARNLSPGTWLFGLPRSRGALAPSSGAAVDWTVEHANNFSARSGNGLTVIFDGSTTVTSLAVRSAAGTGWEWGLEVPFVHHGGGFTDGFIEGYHDLVGLPGGGREAVPRNRLDYRIIADGQELVNVTDSGMHLGDVRAWAGYRLHSAPGREAVLRAMAEAPTGALEHLSGSDTTDLSLALDLVDARWLEAFNVQVTATAGITRPGDADLLRERQRDVVWSGHLGLHRPLTRRWTMTLQLDAHTALFDTGVAPFAEGAVLGTVGSTVDLSPRVRLHLGIVEDLTPHRAPDVVLLVALGTRL